jgi:hypothetical protein
MLRTALVVAVPEAVAETYAALGRKSDAREFARLALPLLVEADPVFEKDRVHASWPRRLAGEH